MMMLSANSCWWQSKEPSRDDERQGLRGQPEQQSGYDTAATLWIAEALRRLALENPRRFLPTLTLAPPAFL